MKIESSNIEMQSQHLYTEINAKSERLQMWVDKERPEIKAYLLDISEQARKAVQAAAPMEASADIELSDKDKMKIELIEKMIEIMTGKKIKITPLKLKKSSSGGQPQLVQNAGAPSPQKLGWGLQFDAHQVHYEREEASFAAQGIIKTADGRQINFSVNMQMTREFRQEQAINIRAGDAKTVDPLIINFGGTAAELTETKFEFDLDSNGTKDQISFVGPNSGFLALDLNNDGTINNGRELFGPNTGNGFNELAQFDTDQNQWIDENDAIFDKLRIWSKDAQGKDQLIALGQRGVGAIYLGNIQTGFAFKDNSNDLNGQLVSSGIYVKDNGTVGTVQQVDLAI